MLELIHNNYNAGVTEIYVLVPIVIIGALLLWSMVRAESKSKRRNRNYYEKRS